MLRTSGEACLPAWPAPAAQVASDHLANNVDWAASARFYTRNGTFWTDMLACLPIFAQVAVAASGSSAQLLRLIATLRLLRLIRWAAAGHAVVCRPCADMLYRTACCAVRCALSAADFCKAAVCNGTYISASLGATAAAWCACWPTCPGARSAARTCA